MDLTSVTTLLVRLSLTGLDDKCLSATRSHVADIKVKDYVHLICISKLLITKNGLPINII